MIFKYALVSVLESVLCEVWKRGVSRSNDTTALFILGMPRSGTTILLEWSEELLNARRIYEPFTQIRNHRYKNKDLPADVIDSLVYISSKSKDHDAVANFIQKISKNEISELATYPMKPNVRVVLKQLIRSFSANRTIVKEVCPMLTGYLANKTKSKVVVLVRHPISCVYSQARQWNDLHRLFTNVPADDLPRSPRIPHYIADDHPNIIKFITKNRTFYHSFLFETCLSYYIAALESSQSESVFFCSYESLLENGTVREALAEFIGEKIWSDELMAFHKKSATTIDQPKGGSNHKWMADIPEKEMSDTLEMMNNFGMELDQPYGRVVKILNREVL